MSKNSKGKKPPHNKAKNATARAAQRTRDRSLALIPPRRRPPRQRTAAFITAPKPNRSPRAGLTVRLAQLDHAAGLPLPAYQSAGAAGLDLIAALPAKKPLRLTPRARALVPTGIVMELPPGWEAQIRPRSGLALKQGITVLNSPGTIDSDYRGEVQVILVNLGSKAFRIARGERIAQLVIAPAPQARITAVSASAITKTTRGDGGFGSTGTKTRVPAARTAAKNPRPTKKKSAAPKQVSKQSTSRRGPR